MSPAERPTLVELQTMQAAQTLLEARFVSRNQGGYSAQVFGYEAFMPGSHSLVPSTVPLNEDPLVSTSHPVVLIEVRSEPFKLVISRRQAKPIVAAQAAASKEARRLEQEARTAEFEVRRNEELASLSIGDIVEATVTHTINPPGLTILRAGSVKIGIPKAELGWGDVAFPERGQTFACVITSIDRGRQHTQGSIKKLLPDPWEKVPASYPVGASVMGRVKTIASFGIFLELEPGLDCLLHRNGILGASASTELAHHFASGDQVPLLLDTVDTAQRRIGAKLALDLTQWGHLRNAQIQLHAAEQLNKELTAQLVDYTQRLVETEQAATHYQLHQTEVYAQLLAEKQQVELTLDENQAQLAEQHVQYQELAVDLAVTKKRLDIQAQQSEHKLAATIASYKTEINSLDIKLKQSVLRNETLEKEKAKLVEQNNAHEKQVVDLQKKIQLFEKQVGSVPPPTSENLQVFPTNSTAVYITISNSKQLVTNVNMDEEFDDCEPLPDFPNFNRLETQQLLAYQQLCQFPHRYLGNAATRVRKHNGKMLFGNKAPAFHRSHDCRFALSDYINYEVPDEIKAAGKEVVFREWWAQRLEGNSKYRDSPLLMDKLLIDCQIQFKLTTRPRQFTAPNSDVIALTKQDIKDIESEIAKVIKDAASYANSTADHQTILRRNGKHAYKGSASKHPVDNATKLTDEEVRAILRRYENDYKKVLFTLLQTYYRSKYNNSLAFDHSLLIAAGFNPCYGCFGSDADKMLRQAAPLTEQDPDDDLPF